MPSSYPASVDAIPLPDWSGALGQPARTAESFLTDVVDSVKAVQTALGTTNAPGPILVQGGLVFNVKDFGALGNGVANDTAPIQAALTASAGKELVFPPGTYLLSSAVTIPATSSMTISGTPGGSIIKAHSTKALTSELFKTTVTGAPTRPIKNLTIRGLVFDGASLAPERWLQNPVTHATITNPEADYYDASTNPSGKIGNPSFPTYDVDDLITDNRRNPNVDTQAPLVRLSLTQDTLVEKCIFRNHFGMGLTEAGGLNVKIQHNLFHNVGKNDGPYQAIWCQSYGDPEAPTGTFQDSENTQIMWNSFRDLERGALIFAATKGGKVIGNNVYNTGELGMFFPHTLHTNGGTTEVAHNVIKTVRITDIVANGIECEQISDISFHDNHIEDTDEYAILVPGLLRGSLRNNTTKDCYRTHAVKYGPFSERFSFNVGTPSIAGASRPVADGGVFQIGTRSSIGTDAVTIAGNIIRETRGSYPWVFRQTKTGTNSVSERLTIENNVLDVPALMASTKFLDVSIGFVWDSTMSLHIRNNPGHVSAAPVVVTKQFAVSETGPYVVSCDFRPRIVRVYAAPSATATGQACMGTLTWQPDGSGLIFTEYISTNSSGQRLGINGTQLARLADDTDAVTFTMTFTSWKELGFTVAVGTCSAITNVRFVCEP